MESAHTWFKSKKWKPAVLVTGKVSEFNLFQFFCVIIFELPWDSRNYMPPILVSSSAKRIATQILVIPKLNGRKDFILRNFVCDIIRPSKELPVQS